MNIRAFGSTLRTDKRKMNNKSEKEQREVASTEGAFSIHVEGTDDRILLSVWEDLERGKARVTVHSSTIEIDLIDSKKVVFSVNLNHSKGQ
jgi:hypothetical protein